MFVFLHLILKLNLKLDMQSIDHFLLRKGLSTNVMVFPDSDYDNTAFSYSNGQFIYAHSAYGADSFRFSWNFGQNWTDWKPWEDVTYIGQSTFEDPSLFWDGHHIMVQCKNHPYPQGHFILMLGL